MVKKADDPERLQEGKAIKAVCVKIKDQYGLSWLELLNQKIGLSVTKGYHQNIGAGTAGGDAIKSIKQWIIAHEIETAHKVAPKYFPRSLVTDWQNFVETRGIYNRLFTKPYESSSLQLHEISPLNPLNPNPIKLGQEFAFEIDSPIAGSVIALDHYKNEWFPIPLSSNNSLAPIKINAGLYGFPIQDHDLKQIIPSRQNSFDGEHGHCFIIGPDQLLNYYCRHFDLKRSIDIKLLNEMADRFSEYDNLKIAVLRENVLFTR